MLWQWKIQLNGKMAIINANHKRENTMRYLCYWKWETNYFIASHQINTQKNHFRQNHLVFCCSFQLLFFIFRVTNDEYANCSGQNNWTECKNGVGIEKKKKKNETNLSENHRIQVNVCFFSLQLRQSLSRSVAKMGTNQKQIDSISMCCWSVCKVRKNLVCVQTFLLAIDTINTLKIDWTKNNFNIFEEEERMKKKLAIDKRSLYKCYKSNVQCTKTNTTARAHTHTRSPSHSVPV